MSWRALRGSDGTARRIGATPEGVLGQGTLIIECDGPALAQTKGAILRVDPSREPERIFAIDRRRGGEVSLLLRNGAAASHLAVVLPEAAEGHLHLIYRWDCDPGLSILTCGNGERRAARWSGQGQVPPITGEQIATLFTSRHGAFRHPAITGLAFADHLMPLGPVPGLVAGTSVSTPGGPRSVETLRPGDLVMTAGRGWQPILWQGGIELPVLPGFLPIRLLAPYHELDHDLVVLPEQRIVLSGRDVEYQFGAERVLVRAGDLRDGHTALVEERRTATLHFHAVVLESPDAIHASGGWVESLHLGALAGNADRARLAVCGDLVAAGALPLHPAPPVRGLRPFEVAALRRMRDARRAPFAV